MLCPGLGDAEEPAAGALSALTLKGYLGKEEVDKASKAVEQAAASHAETVVIEVSSSSGDLNLVLNLAKTLYSFKAENKAKVVVYINDKAIGPAAIIPFLADELYTSLFVSWGDIPLGSETVVPTNILRNQVTSLIADDNPHASLLRLMGAAMTDKNLLVIDDNGWKIPADGKDSSHPVISGQGETLVVNQNQLRDLKLAAGIVSPEKFHSLFPFSTQQKEELTTPPLARTTLEVAPGTVEQQLKDHIKFNAHGPNTVGYITIDDRDSGINQSTWLYVKKALDFYKETKPAFVILELNTPGGEVFASQKISDALKELDTQYNIPVVAYINNWAISAGAMLAYSCRFIAVVKDGSMGAAEPVIQGTSGQMEAASEKVNSALRADFASRAGFFGRNPSIAEAMVDKDIILVFRHGQVVKLNSESEVRATGPDPDVVITPKGKLLTLNSELLMKYGVADMLLLPAKLDPVTAEEKGAGKWPARKSLLFQQPFFATIPQTTIQAYVMDWKTHLFVILASPAVSSLLFLGMLVGFYVELNNPGLSLPGSIAITCLLLIILSSLSLEIANWLELILLLTGILIILVELFILPTFGLLGFVGIVFFLVGLFGMMLPGASSVSFEWDTRTLNAAGEAFFERLGWLCGTLLLAFVIIMVMARYITPTFSGFNRFVLTGHEQEGFIANEDPTLLPTVGTKGEAFSPLRPAGKVLIKGTIYDAISSGGFIEKGKGVVVATLDGSVIVVREDIGDEPRREL